MCVCVSPLVKWCAIKHGQTPLFVAAAEDHYKVVECLLTEARVNPNQAAQVLSVIKDVCDHGVCVWR